MGHRRVIRTATIGVVIATAALTSCGGSDDEPSVTFRAPADGANVAGGVTLDMSADGVTIEEAGEAHAGAGHFHVIIDDGCVAEGTTVPKDADHVHFGKGQTSGTVYLSPGQHTLCLQVADGVHKAMAVSDSVTVSAGISTRDEWCKAIRELDVLFTETDTNGEPFAVRQVGYENAHRLLEQLDEAIEEVDATARADVGAALEVGMTIAATFSEGADEQSAFDEVQAVLQASNATLAAGAPWINQECGVDIDG